VNRLAKQAHPTFRKPELDELVKDKFLELIPDDLENLLELVLIDKDMESVELAKLVSLAEQLENIQDTKIFNAERQGQIGEITSFNIQHVQKCPVIHERKVANINEANNQFHKRMCANVQISSVNDVLCETTNNKIKSVVESSEQDIENLNLNVNENSEIIISNIVVEPLVENVEKAISNFNLNYIEDGGTNIAMNEIETTINKSEEASCNLNDQYDIDSGMGSFDDQVEPEGMESAKYDLSYTYNKNSGLHSVDSEEKTEPESFQAANYNFSYQYDESDKIDTFSNETEPKPVSNKNVNYNYQYDQYNKDNERDSFDSEVKPEPKSFQTTNNNFCYQYSENDKLSTFNNEPEPEPMSNNKVYYRSNYQYENYTMDEWCKENKIGIVRKSISNLKPRSEENVKVKFKTKTVKCDELHVNKKGTSETRVRDISPFTSKGF
ncbi:unnamed protein product, partial [Rotaria socialis]